jgi:hypothetical protein
MAAHLASQRLLSAQDGVSVRPVGLETPATPHLACACACCSRHAWLLAARAHMRRARSSPHTGRPWRLACRPLPSLACPRTRAALSPSRVGAPCSPLQPSRVGAPCNPLQPSRAGAPCNPLQPSRPQRAPASGLLSHAATSRRYRMLLPHAAAARCYRVPLTRGRWRHLPVTA